MALRRANDHAYLTNRGDRIHHFYNRHGNVLPFTLDETNMGSRHGTLSVRVPRNGNFYSRHGDLVMQAPNLPGRRLYYHECGRLNGRWHPSQPQLGHAVTAVSAAGRRAAAAIASRIAHLIGFCGAPIIVETLGMERHHGNRTVVGRAGRAVTHDVLYPERNRVREYGVQQNARLLRAALQAARDRPGNRANHGRREDYRQR